jgi:hypothetical protein
VFGKCDGFLPVSRRRDQATSLLQYAHKQFTHRRFSFYNENAPSAPAEALAPHMMMIFPKVYLWRRYMSIMKAELRAS